MARWLGRGFKLKKYLLNIAIPKFDVPMYIKMESTFPFNFGVIYLGGSAPQIFTTPFISPKKSCSVYMVHGTQNDRLEFMVSTQK